jgi:NADPH:quinone reductase-like Zn-dependent oxidoreductase
MKALVYRRYGAPDVLGFEEIEQPVPAANEALIRVHAASLNGSDRENLLGRPLYARIGGLRSPGRRIPGSDIAGRVEAVGQNQTEFRPGDEVFGELPGYSGGLAEYVCTGGKTLALKPAGISFEEAAAIPQAGTIALQAMRDQGRVQPGQRVLINGAGGSAGSFAVQLARLYGAIVTGVDSEDKLDFVRSLGADETIDYAAADFTRSDKQYDLILDVIAHHSVRAYQRSLAPNGTCFIVGGSVAVLLQAVILGPLIGRKAGRRIRILAVPQSRNGLAAISELCATGQVVPQIDRLFPFDEAPEAMRYLVEGRARGKVVISLDSA